MSNSSHKESKRYQDYVIRDGRFIGQFDDMYRNAVEIPWHQDKTVNAVFSDLTVTLLRRLRPLSLLDVGCGLGYMAARLKCEIPELSRVVGLEISETAVVTAQNMFPDIEFRAGSLAPYTTGEGRQKPLMWLSVRMCFGMCWMIWQDILQRLQTAASVGYISVSLFLKVDHFLGRIFFPMLLVSSILSNHKGIVSVIFLLSGMLNSIIENMPT